MHLLWPRRRFGVYFGDHLGELRALLGAELRKRRPKSVLGELFTRLAGAERCSGLLQFAHSPLCERVRAMASLIAVSRVASNAPRRGVGQWGGAGGACCEDHLAFCGELLRFAAL